MVGRNAEANYKIAQKLAKKISRIPGAADVHVHQVAAQPEIHLNVDRVKASQLGLTQRDVTSSMLISLSGSSTVAPNFWMNWTNGVNYNVGVQTPQYRIDSLDALLRTPISVATDAESGVTAGFDVGRVAAEPTLRRRFAQRRLAGLRKSRRDGRQHQLLSNLVTVQRDYVPVIVNHYNVLPVFDVYANVDRRDLGGVGAEVRKIMRDEDAASAARNHVQPARAGGHHAIVLLPAGLGMIFAVVLVYLLMTVNFQSWLDPFIILTALPGAMAGILWMLFVTGTTLSVPSLMGAIMCVGVATANSILMVTFANDERADGVRARDAMLSAGLRAHPAGADDGHRHDPGHASHGARAGRRRRAECAAGPRGDRRPDVRHGHHAVRGPDHLYLPAQASPRWITSAAWLEREREAF